MPTKKESHHRRVLLGPMIGNKNQGVTPRSRNATFESTRKGLTASDDNNSSSSRSWHEEVFKPPTSKASNCNAVSTSNSVGKREKKLEHKIQRLQNELRITEARYKTILKGKDAELELLRSERPTKELERKDQKIHLLEGELETLTAIITQKPPFSIPNRYQDVPPELEFDCFADKKDVQAALRRFTLQNYMAKAERSYLQDTATALVGKENDAKKMGVATNATIASARSTRKDEQNTTTTTMAPTSHNETGKLSDHDNHDIYKNESESITWSSSAGSSSSSTENVPPQNVAVSKKELVQAWRKDGALGSPERWLGVDC